MWNGSEDGAVEVRGPSNTGADSTAEGPRQIWRCVRDTGTHHRDGTSHHHRRGTTSQAGFV